MARKQRYPELALIARLITGSGYLAITVGVITGVAGVYNAWQTEDLVTILMSLGTGLLGLLYGIVMIAAAQVIRLLMDIERNTRPHEPAAAELLER